MNLPWHIRLIGELAARQGEREVMPLRTGSTCAVLAFLALDLDLDYPRERVADAIWPDALTQKGLHSLRQAISVLRRTFEPPDTARGSVIMCTRSTVRLNPRIVTTDVQELLDCLDQFDNEDSLGARQAHFHRATRLFRGELLPGYDYSWVTFQRSSLIERFKSAFFRIVTEQKQAHALYTARESAVLARQVVGCDEEVYQELIALCRALGKTGEAERYQLELRQYLQLLETEPSAGSLVPITTAANASCGRAVITADVRRPPHRRKTAPEDPGGMCAPNEMPLKPISSRLPLALTRFFGREAELAQLCHMLQPVNPSDTDAAQLLPPARLVTLLGPGGSGKSRLAVEVLGKLKKIYAGQICFVRLERLTDPGLILDAVRDDLGLRPDPHRAPLEQIAEALHGKPALLALDNFEHLLLGVDAVWSLLERISTLTCLVTSRCSLNLQGEQELQIGPFPIPCELDDPAKLLGCDSVGMLVDRAKAVRPDFQVTPRNAATIAALCARLEGLPLAIEIAASHAHILSPAQMLRELDHRFEFLIDRKRRVSGRHCSLRAVLDLSYCLLPPQTRPFFARLSVFRGGWTLEGARTVCREPLALDYLEELCRSSLILAEECGTEMRYRMLETVREYAFTQMDSEMRSALYVQHCNYYQDFAERATAQLTGPEVARAVTLLEHEHDNLRAALERGSGLSAMGLAGTLWRFWHLRGYLREARQWYDRVLATEDGVEEEVRARALLGAGIIACALGDRRQARVWLTTLYKIREKSGDRVRMAGALSNLAMLAVEENNLAEARSVYERAVEIWREHGGMERSLACGLVNLSGITAEQRDFPAARAALEESLQLFQKMDDRVHIASAHYNLAHMMLRQDNLLEALGHYRRCLTDWWTLGNRKDLLLAMRGIAIVGLHLGDYTRAAQLLSAVQAERTSMGASRSVINETEDRTYRAKLLAALGEDALNALTVRGFAMPVTDAVPLALQVRAHHTDRTDGASA